MGNKSNMKILQKLEDLEVSPGRVTQPESDSAASHPPKKTIVTRSSGDVDSMVRKIHESVGTAKIKEIDSVDIEDRIVDAPPPKTIESTDPPEDPEPVKPASLKTSITTDQMDAIIGMRVEAAEEKGSKEREKLEEQLVASIAAIAAIEKQRKDDLAMYEAQAEFFGKYGFGKPSDEPARARESDRSHDRKLSPILLGGLISSQDAWKEYCGIYDQSQTETITSRQGHRMEQRDTRNADSWFKEHFNKMIPAIDDFGRKNGLLKNSKEAITARADVAPMFLETLSAYVRMTHHPAHIWGMFANVTVELGKRFGEIVDVPRFAYAMSRRNRSDWDLTGVATLSTAAQAIQAGMSQVTVKEWGMGKPGLPTDTNAPIGMSMFLNAISVMDLMTVVNTNLGYNYREFETAQILDGLYARTPVHYYNKGNAIVTDPAQVLANDNGTCTVGFMRTLASQMASDNVPPYANGKYALVVGPNELKQIEDSLDPIKQVIQKADMAEMTRIFAQAVGVGNFNYDGYKGDIGDFMIFSTNTLYQGPVAAPLGVTLQEAIATGPRDVHIGYAFGANSVARGIAQPFNVRRSSNTDFDRSQILVWNSYEGFGALDINSTLDVVSVAVPQQNRVFELHFAVAKV